MTRSHRLLILAALLPVLLPTAALAARCPNILVVFDVSGSMNATVSGTTQNRYQVGRDAVKALLNGNSANFRYGLELFGTSANSGCGVSSCYYTPSNCTGSPCACESVQCDYNTTAAISAVLDARSFDSLTPTAIAINTARTRPDMSDSTRNRYIILLTDGDPNCATGSATAIDETVAALNSARTANIKTYVLGFAGGSADRLNSMAIAGGTQRYTTCNTTNQKCFYDAATPSELNAALAAIVSAVGGELGGGGACDDTCYGGGCSAGQICKNAACVTDPCASVTCPSGVCVEGQCKAFCDPACFNNQYCDNGECKAEAPSCPGDGGCSGRNQTCINGACVEDYCGHPTAALNCGSAICIKNSCQVFSGGAGGGAGGGTGGGTGGGAGRDGGSGNGVNSAGTGCCSGAPGATSLFGLLFGLSTLAGMRRRIRKS